MGEDNNEDEDDDEDDPTTFSTTTCSFGFSMGSTLTDAAGAPSAMGTTRLPAMPIRGILVFQL